MGNDRQNDLTKKTLIDKLRSIIEIEMQKPVEQLDDTLVAECADFLMELEEKEKLSDAEISRRVSLIFGADSNIIIERRGIRALIVAACLAALLLAAGVVATAFGFDAFSALKQFGENLIEMVVGEETQVGNITIRKDSSSYIYHSLDGFLDDGNMDVLYPTVLPNDAKIDSVHYEKEESPKMLYFKSDNPNINFSIQLDSSVSDVIVTNAVSVETINGFKCYFAITDVAGQCAFEFGADTYTVFAPTYEDVVLIINNLKESKQ